MYGFELTDYAEAYVRKEAASTHVRAAWEHYEECCKEEQEAAEACDKLYTELMEKDEQDRRTEYERGRRDALTAVSTATEQMADGGGTRNA